MATRLNKHYYYYYYYYYYYTEDIMITNSPRREQFLPCTYFFINITVIHRHLLNDNEKCHYSASKNST